MNLNTIARLGALSALAGLATSASAAFQNGDLIYTDALSNTVNINSGGSNSNLYTFAGSDVRLAGITRANGRWYINSGFASPSDPSEGAIFELKKLFGATQQSTLASSDPILNPIGIAYHRASDRLLSVNNPGPGSNVNEGILGTRTGDGNIILTYEEDPSQPRPRYQAGSRLVRDTSDANVFYVMSVNGGELDGPGNEGKGSAIFRLDVDGAGNGTVSLVADLSFTSFGNITFVRGIATDGQSFFFGDNQTNAIYSLDVSGDLTTLQQIVTGVTRPNDIIYNPYTNKIIWSDNFDEAIYQVNTDGTGFETLATGVNARGLYVIPTPGAVTLLGLAGLAAVRRRR